jgi:N-methylhydantoinase A
VDTERTYVVRSADMCYVGQSFDVHVPLPDVLEHVTLPDAIARFHEPHTAIYGHADSAAATRFMTARLQIVGVTSKPALAETAVDGVWSSAADGARSRELYENGRT